MTTFYNKKSLISVPCRYSWRYSSSFHLWNRVSIRQFK